MELIGHKPQPLLLPRTRVKCAACGRDVALAQHADRTTSGVPIRFVCARCGTVRAVATVVEFVAGDDAAHGSHYAREMRRYARKMGATREGVVTVKRDVGWPR